MPSLEITFAILAIIYRLIEVTKKSDLQAVVENYNINLT